jgi:uncharacterized protein involved in type VI secretion and phage assembly
MSQVNGVVIGVVKSVDDPQGEGRILVDFASLPGRNRSFWAPVASLMAGGARGAWFMPEIDDEALVAFNHGDVDHPYIIGFLWNGQDRPPKTDPQVRLLRSVNGHEIEIYDPDVSQGDKGHIRIKDAHGNSIELANGRISITSVSFIEIKAPQVVINGRPVSLAPGPI